MMEFTVPEFLCCPHCGASLVRDGGSLYCTGERRHTYDIAKEGYVNLLPPGRAKNSHTGDDADMVRAREEFLSGGGYDRYSREAAELAAEVMIEYGYGKAVTGSGEAVPKGEDIARCSEGIIGRMVVGSLEVSGEAVPISENIARCSEGIIGRTVVGSLEVSGEAVPISEDTPDVSSEIVGRMVVGSLEVSGEAVPIYKNIARCSEGIIGRMVVGQVPSSNQTNADICLPVLTGVDAGCGEGRHTVNMAKTLAKSLGVPVTMAGFDASKFGVRAAAKRYVKNSGNTPAGVTPVFAAANIFALPVSDGCADVFTSLFAPLPDDEVRRVLKCGGVLVICAAGKDHLAEMRRVLYENPVPSGGGAAVPDGFTTTREKIIEYKISLTSHEEIMSLFTMTPFYYNAPAEGREKLEALSSLEVTVQVKCTVAVKD